MQIVQTPKTNINISNYVFLQFSVEQHVLNWLRRLDFKTTSYLLRHTILLEYKQEETKRTIK